MNTQKFMIKQQVEGVQFKGAENINEIMEWLRNSEVVTSAGSYEGNNDNDQSARK